MVEPGEWRVRQALCDLADRIGVELVIRTDRGFLSSVAEFNDWAAGRKQLRLEYFYREMRRKSGVLMEGDGPIGDAWNFDKANRGSFGVDGPGLIPEPASFKPDPITRQVLALVNSRFADHPGSLDAFDWPVTTAQARRALGDFVAHRLPHFGAYQDAMWIGQPWLYHARLSAALNLHLLDPREVIDAAEQALREGHAPLNSVEGFVRQILGWREYVRGVYWRYMPEYIDRNTLNASSELPEFYWTGQTEMRCLSESIGQTLNYGYAHHIQRLMVTGLFGLLAGVDPKQMHRWYLAVYVDAVEWVELPNVLGMSQYADDGVMASKPYAASGKYISRMSNYCRQCRFDPLKSVGENACPFTTLYWDFLARHRQRLAGNGRMRMSLKNLERRDRAEVSAIRKRAQHVVRGLT
jgi:deoxyribodipyrimidine photolyase-related protein